MTPNQPTPAPTPRTDAHMSDSEQIKTGCAEPEFARQLECDLSGFLAVLGHPITPDDTADSALSKVVMAMADLQAIKREVKTLKEQVTNLLDGADATKDECDRLKTQRDACGKLAANQGVLVAQLQEQLKEAMLPDVEQIQDIYELYKLREQLKAANELRVSGGDTIKGGIVRAFVEFPAGTPIRVVGTLGQCLTAHRARTQPNSSDAVTGAGDK